MEHGSPVFVHWVVLRDMYNTGMGWDNVLILENHWPPNASFAFSLSLSSCGLTF